ncbi:MAG: type II secretion system GspH family protein [Verrucomicrobiota bacterium]|nr:type II secretion system GspH family protein [Verrucomicrobiota bacterium]
MDDLTKKLGARGAFTLIELLVVITIIAILMALLFPAFQGVQNQAKRTQAKNDATQVVTAVNAYFTEYGKMPVDDTKQGFDTLAGDPGGTYDNAFILNILRAIDDTNWNAGNKYNPKQIVFFSGSDAKSATNPRSGFATQDATVNGVAIKKGALVDPWGGEYLVSIDSDYDNWTQQFFSYTDLTYTSKTGGSGTFPAVQATATASSWGKDNKFGTNGDSKYKESDDVISWQ